MTEKISIIGAILLIANVFIIIILLTSIKNFLDNRIDVLLKILN